MIRRAALCLALLTGPASADCLTASTGAGCHTARFIKPPPTKAETLGPPPIAIGATIERGTYSIILNARYYGLPDARDGWVYYRIADDVYRVDYRTMQVLERATAETSANWP